MGLKSDNDPTQSGHAQSSGGRADGVGVVVIGRNEGPRALKALESVPEHVEALVYVDSDSTDGSREAALESGFPAIRLETPPALTAARGRNEGMRFLQAAGMLRQFVQFLDGDCELDDNWISTGSAYLIANPRVAGVAGRLKEKAATSNFYRRVLDVEWRVPPSKLATTGGIFLARASALDAVGGFDESLPFGEEADLCLRLRAVGWQIHRIDEPMAIHDSGFEAFGQWWRRCVRSGMGISQGGTSLRKVLPRMFWGLGLPAAFLAAAVTTTVAPMFGLWTLTVLSGLVVAQLVRLTAQTRRRRSVSVGSALAYALHMVGSKVPECVGIAKWLVYAGRQESSRHE